MKTSRGRRRVVLATFGTLGDIHPFIALAKALQERSAEPVLATSAMHRGLVEGEGIAFAPMRPDETDIARAHDIDIAELFRRMVASPFFLLDEIYIRFLGETFADVLAAADGAHALVVHSLLNGAQLAAERSGLPWVRVALSPVHLQSAQAPSLTPPLPYVLEPRGLGDLARNRALRRLLRQRLALKLRPVRRFRGTVGLPPSRLDSYLDCGGRNEANAVVGFYSRHFAPKQTDHPPNAEVVGFPFYRSTLPDGAALMPAIEAFLAAGEPPVVFTLGSFATESAGAFYEESVAAARRIGVRALLLTGSRGAQRLAFLAGDDAHVCPYAPHDLVFTRCACIVHHGGIGTAGQALRSGRPQLVVPFFGDQLDIAARLVRLRVAEALRPADYTAARAAALLGRLLAEPRAECATFAAAVQAEDGAGRLADMILTLQV